MYKNKSIISWAVYDWANSVFATVVIAGFFPIVFKSYWASNLSDTDSTFWLGISNALSSIAVVFIAPFIGVIGDKFNIQKPMLFGFMIIGVVSTSLFYFNQQGNWQLAILLYVIATIGFMAANIFYDALLVSVSKSSSIEKVSGFGYGLGYLGGGIALAFCVMISQQPEILGFDQTIDAVLFCFLMVGIWWFVFSLPLMLWVKEVEPVEKTDSVSITAKILSLFKIAFKNKQTRWFLIAYWLYIDGVDTIIRMAVDYGMALGFDTADLIQALLITQFVGFPAAIIYGYVGSRVGVKKSLLGGILAYVIITWLGYNMQTTADFYQLAILIGLVQGGVQAMSRAYYSQLIPEEQAAEYFGIYNMLGKSAAVLGPLMMGGVAVLTGSHRLSILSVVVLFVIGALVLLKVKTPEKT